MVQKELFHMFGNGKQDNIVFTIDAGDTVTCHFKEKSGSDSATDKYFNLGSEAKKVHILVDKAATITHMNNHELKSPRTLSIGGNVHRDGIEWGSIVVRADSDSTTFEVYAS